MKRRSFLGAALAFVGMPTIDAERIEIPDSNPREFESFGGRPQSWLPSTASSNPPNPHVGSYLGDESTAQMCTGSRNIAIGRNALRHKATT